jgi:hypothetical protein
MSETNTQQSVTEITQGPEPDANDLSPQWGVSAPRGGKTVVTRALKDGARVPLFLGQTLISSLRDLGYNSTICRAPILVKEGIEFGVSRFRGRLQKLPITKRTPLVHTECCSPSPERRSDPTHAAMKLPVARRGIPRPFTKGVKWTDQLSRPRLGNGDNGPCRR